MDRCLGLCPIAGHLADRCQGDKYLTDMAACQSQESHLYGDSRNSFLMDRFKMARAFKVEIMKEKVRKIDDPFALQQVCCELLDNNFYLRESIRQCAATEIPKKTDFDSAYLR